MTGKQAKLSKYLIEDAEANRDILFANTIPEAKKQAKRLVTPNNKVFIRTQIARGGDIIITVTRDENNKIEFHDHKEYLQWKKSGRKHDINRMDENYGKNESS